jgi:hypothetical protein
VIIEMRRRIKILAIAIPVAIVVVVGIVTTLSLPFFTLGPEPISIYTTTYTDSDFSIDDVKVKYYTSDELTVNFYISGGDGSKDLVFSFICRDASDDPIYTSTSGTLTIQGVGYTPLNSTSLNIGDLVEGVLLWDDVPTGDQAIKAIISLDNIATDTESFSIELRQ